MVGTVIVNEGKGVRPSQLIASVGPTGEGARGDRQTGPPVRSKSHHGSNDRAPKSGRPQLRALRFAFGSRNRERLCPTADQARDDLEGSAMSVLPPRLNR